MRRWLAVVALVGLMACGRETLTGDESWEIIQIEGAIARNVLNGSDHTKMLNGVDRLIELARVKPCALENQRTVRQVLEDAASTLEPYRPEQAARLDRALAGIPPC